MALFKKFQAEEARIVEVEAFTKSKPIISDLLIHVGQTLPTNMALDSLDFRDNGLVMRITVRGTDAALGYTTNYIEQLRGDKRLGLFDDFSITTSTRNPSTGRLAVELFLRYRPPAGAKKP